MGSTLDSRTKRSERSVLFPAHRVHNWGGCFGGLSTEKHLPVAYMILMLGSSALPLCTSAS